MKPTGKDLIARRIARLFESGQLINLGIGMPTLVSSYIPSDVELIFQSENGFVGMGGPPPEGQEDWDLVNAGGQYVTIRPGGVFFDSTDSFGLIRGGHVDATVLGTFEVDQEGNIANYLIPGKMVAGMGGAMDLCCGAAKVIIATMHTDKHSKSKILKKCTLPLTACNEADIIVTDLALMEVAEEGLVLREKAPGVTVDEIVAKTEADLIIPESVPDML